MEEEEFSVAELKSRDVVIVMIITFLLVWLLQRFLRPS